MTTPHDDPAPDRWLTRQDIRERYHIGIPNMQIRRWEKTHKFPPKQKLAGTDRWSEQSILAWLQQQG
jgi:predicted DNA-binding transcriptional regulator AlpA